MQLHAPKYAIKAFDKFSNWGQVPVFKIFRFEVMRLDVLLIFWCLLCTAFGYYRGGWIGAAQEGLLYVFIVMCALWMFRK